MKTAIIIPTYDEGANIKSLLTEILELNLGARILVVDDASPDGTGRIVEEIAHSDGRVAVLHRDGREGYGRALTAGFRRVLREMPDVEAILSMDADHSHQPKQLPAIIEALVAGNDVVIGSRYVRGGGVSHWGVHRRVLSRCGNLYTRIVTGLPLRDCTSGYVGYRRAVLEAIDLDQLQAHGYSFLIELKFLAWQMGFRLFEAPILFVEREVGRSKMTLGIALEAIRLAWRLRSKRSSRRPQRATSDRERR